VIVKTPSLPGSVTAILTGGTPGVILSTTNACLNTNGTATAGSAGMIVTNAPGVPMGTVLAVDPCILPVEYAYFTAGPGVQNSVRLDWKTATEINNERFVIEHSTDAYNFTNIGQVLSASTNGLGADYGFIHRTPNLGDNWYRLRQYDRDGRSSVSEIKRVTFTPTAATIQKLYPNPVSVPNEVVMELMMPQDGSANLSIYNVMGQAVFHMPATLDAGLNSLHIPTQALVPGIYFVKLNAGSQGEVVVKLKVN
jgi:hypothetical protein